MQQLQRPALQQLQAWQHQHTAQRYGPRPLVGSSPAYRQQSAALQGLRLRCDDKKHVRDVNCRSAGADAGTGDVVRPSAQAAAPPAAPVDLTGQDSQTSAKPAGKGSGGGGYSSYTDMYKALNSTNYSRHVDSSSSKSKHSSGPSSVPSSPASTSTGTQADSTASLNSSNGHLASNSSSISLPADTQTSTAAVDAAGVEDAIRKAQEALAAAENSLTSIHQLRSAQPASKWHGVLQLLRSIAIVATSGALLVASHAFGLGWQWAGATLGAIGLAARAYYRETVTPAGAAVVAAASLATLGCSLRFGLVMLAYSYTSHKLRQFKESRTAVDYEQLTKPAKPQARDWPEILCIAFLPTVLAVAYGAMAGCLDLPLGSLPAVETWRADLLTLLQGAVLGWFACCCGDAWASELGSLSSDQPRLVTTLQPVRRGTHGAITLLGLSGAAAGGLLMGSLFYCAAVLSPTLWVFEVQRQAAMAQWKLIPLGLIAGVLGSLVDSLLGAALQFTGYNSNTASLSSIPGPGVSRISGWFSQKWISDNVINVLAGTLTAVLTAVAALRMFG